MADLNFQFGGGEAGSKAASWFGRIFTFVFAIPFAGFGVFAIWEAGKKISGGKVQEGLFASLFGLLFAGVGFGLMFASITAGRRKKAAEAKWQTQTEGGQKLWLARSDWAAGKIKSATGGAGRVFLIMGVMFSVIGGLASYMVIERELPKGNYASLLVFIFPIVGIAFLVAVVRGIQARRRFGDCYFELAQIPAPLGGSLDGLIQTARPLKLEQGLHLKLSCIRRTVSGSGDDRSTHENILWQEEKIFRPDTSFPATTEGGSGIPVHFKLPADQPESSLRGNETMVWQLELKSKMRGPDFSAAFEVPVFKVADMATAVMEEPDPTAAWQMPVDEIRRDEHSKIKITDGPDGREFYFPAARNLGMALQLTAFFIIWSGFVWLLFTKGAPLIFRLVFGGVDVLLAYSLFNVWFHSSRIIINPTRVRVTQRRLIFSRTREFDPSAIVRFDLKASMTSDSKTFHDLKLVTRASEDYMAARKARFQQTGERPDGKFKIRDPGGITIASSIASKLEADWLVQQMTKALEHRG